MFYFTWLTDVDSTYSAMCTYFCLFNKNSFTRLYNSCQNSESLLNLPVRRSSLHKTKVKSDHSLMQKARSICYPKRNLSLSFTGLNLIYQHNLILMVLHSLLYHTDINFEIWQIFPNFHISNSRYFCYVFKYLFFP